MFRKAFRFTRSYHPVFSSNKNSCQVCDTRNLGRPPSELWHFGCVARRTIYHYKAYSWVKHGNYPNVCFSWWLFPLPCLQARETQASTVRNHRSWSWSSLRKCNFQRSCQHFLSKSLGWLCLFSVVLGLPGKWKVNTSYQQLQDNKSTAAAVLSLSLQNGLYFPKQTWLYLNNSLNDAWGRLLARSVSCRVAWHHVYVPSCPCQYFHNKVKRWPLEGGLKKRVPGDFAKENQPRPYEISIIQHPGPPLGPLRMLGVPRLGSPRPVLTPAFRTARRPCTRRPCAIWVLAVGPETRSRPAARSSEPHFLPAGRGEAESISCCALTAAETSSQSATSGGRPWAKVQPRAGRGRAGRGARQGSRRIPGCGIYSPGPGHLTPCPLQWLSTAGAISPRKRQASSGPPRTTFLAQSGFSFPDRTLHWESFLKHQKWKKLPAFSHTPPIPLSTSNMDSLSNCHMAEKKTYFETAYLQWSQR